MNKIIKARMPNALDKLLSGGWYLYTHTKDQTIVVCSSCRSVIYNSSRPWEHLLDCGVRPVLHPLVKGVKVELEVGFDELVALRREGLTNVAWCGGFVYREHFEEMGMLQFRTIARD